LSEIYEWVALISQNPKIVIDFLLLILNLCSYWPCPYGPKTHEYSYCPGIRSSNVLRIFFIAKSLGASGVMKKYSQKALAPYPFTQELLKDPFLASLDLGH